MARLFLFFSVPRFTASFAPWLKSLFLLLLDMQQSLERLLHQDLWLFWFHLCSQPSYGYRVWYARLVYKKASWGLKY